MSTNINDFNYLTEINQAYDRFKIIYALNVDHKFQDYLNHQRCYYLALKECVLSEDIKQLFNVYIEKHDECANKMKQLGETFISDILDIYGKENYKLLILNLHYSDVNYVYQTQILTYNTYIEQEMSNYFMNLSNNQNNKNIIDTNNSINNNNNNKNANNTNIMSKNITDTNNNNTNNENIVNIINNKNIIDDDDANNYIFVENIY